MTHPQTDHSDDVSEDELTDVLSESAIHVMGITKCPLCDSHGPPGSPELIEHVLEHIHDFSLRSLPWPKDPVPNLNKPVGAFNVSLKDVDNIAQWVDKTSPEEERLPQLCAIDYNPPAKIEEQGLKGSEKDYFAQNDYFLDESSDGRFPSLSEQWSDTSQYKEHPDDTTLASASHDMTVRFWDTATGAHKQTLEGHSYSVLAVASSPDGTTFASASSDETVRLWDAAAGAHKQTLEGHRDWVRAVAFSP